MHNQRGFEGIASIKIHQTKHSPFKLLAKHVANKKFHLVLVTSIIPMNYT